MYALTNIFEECRWVKDLSYFAKYSAQISLCMRLDWRTDPVTVLRCAQRALNIQFRFGYTDPSI